MTEERDRLRIEKLLQFSMETHKPAYGLNGSAFYSDIEKLQEKKEKLAALILQIDATDECQREVSKILDGTISSFLAIFKELEQLATEQHYKTQRYKMRILLGKVKRELTDSDLLVLDARYRNQQLMHQQPGILARIFQALNLRNKPPSEEHRKDLEDIMKEINSELSKQLQNLTPGPETDEKGIVQEARFICTYV